MPGWRVEHTAEEDDSLAAYCEWTFILNKHYACIYIFQNIQLLFLEIILILIGENISAFISFSIPASYQVIHRRYLDSRYSLDT